MLDVRYTTTVPKEDVLVRRTTHALRFPFYQSYVSLHILHVS